MEEDKFWGAATGTFGCWEWKHQRDVSREDATACSLQGNIGAGGQNRRTPGVEEGVFGDDAGAADAEQCAQDLGCLVAALRDAGPEPAIA